MKSELYVCALCHGTKRKELVRGVWAYCKIRICEPDEAISHICVTCMEQVAKEHRDKEDAS